ncbi:serine/threonine-protein kinase [Nocardia sp. NPDC004654]|uniref:serine/threonine-protein kinase n=1 Tax=Nocardia sp. NPDC004654 TaxID=3154776 RepID=UPI0033BF4D66
MKHIHADDGSWWSYDEMSEPLGKGAFGTVFSGESKTGRAVAIKVIRPQAYDGHLLPAREAEIFSIVSKTSPAPKYVLVPFAVVNDSEDLVIVMPHAEMSLAKAITESPFDQVSAITALLDIAKGIDELAGMGILHRDLKPENILKFGNHWEVTDFGISRDTNTSTAPMTFTIWGTKEYMAPERWMQTPQTVKSDLYAFGIIAYQILAGRLPFVGTRDEVRRQHLTVAPAPLPTDIHPRLSRLVLRLLSKVAEERPPDARYVVETLEECLKQAQLKLSPSLHRLGASSVAAESRRLQAESAVAEAREKQSEDARIRLGALIELDELFQRSVEDIQHILPEAQLKTLRPRITPRGVTYPPHGWELTVSDGGLRVEVWEVVIAAEWEDYPDLCVACAVYPYSGSERREPLANIVCEVRGTACSWHLVTMRRRGKLEGVSKESFPHVWRNLNSPGRTIHTQIGGAASGATKEPFTVDSIADLLGQAIDQIEYNN